MSVDADDTVQPGPDRQRLSAVGLLVDTFTQLPNLLFPIVAGIYGTRDTEIGVLPVIAAVLGLGLIVRALTWLRTYYTISDDDIRIERGLLSRSARSIPIDRIADVTIEQPALARLLSLAVVRFETGGGKGDEAALSYVSQDEAERLRQTVRSRKDGVAAAPDDASAEAPAAQVLFTMDLRRIVTLGLYSFSLIIFGVLLGLAGKFDFLVPDLDQWIGLAERQGGEVSQLTAGQQALGVIGALAVLVILGIGSGIVRIALRDWGFILERTAKGLRRRRGLLTLTDMTMPLERVQGVEIGTGAIRERSGWHSLHLVSAADPGEGKFDQLVAPLAQLDEIWPIMHQTGIAAPGEELGYIRPGFAPRRDRIVLRSLALALVGGVLVAAGLPYAPLVVLPILWLGFRDWLNWRHEGWAIDAGQLYWRIGWWNRVLAIVRQLNVHSVSITRGPLERRHGLASVQFGIANAGISFRGLPLAEAERIRETVLAIITPVDFSQLNRPH